MNDNIINFPAPQVEVIYSPALQKVIAMVDDLSDEDTDLLFSNLWAMGYGATS